MINCELLKFSFVWNFYNKVMDRIYSNIFQYDKIKLSNGNKRNVNFSTSNK